MPLRRLVLWLCVSLSLLLPAAGRPAASPVRVTDLRCDYRVDPAGLHNLAPRLSWRLLGTERWVQQTAYRVLVASDPAKLAEGRADLWDSGQVASEQSVNVVYDGAPLGSRQRCWWTVRSWDQAGRASAWSEPATWSMGLLNPADWQAQWIDYPGPQDEDAPSLDDAYWVWRSVQGDPPAETVYFRGAFDVPADRAVTAAPLVLTADNRFVAYLNGVEVARSPEGDRSWEVALRVDLVDAVRPGRNVLAIEGENFGGPAGLAGRLRLVFADGSRVEQSIDDTWRAGLAAPADWADPDFDDTAWAPVRVLGRVGMAPWGRVRLAGQAELPPCPYLRRGFTVTERPVRATAYVSALGLYELHLNGRKVGADVLTPGWTDYRTRVPYQVYDVTDLLQAGDNVVGAILADGWYAGHVGLVGREVYGPRPALRLQLELEDAAGRITTVASDPSWQARFGPLQHADLLMGEAYDARAELTGWAETLADGAIWEFARLAQLPESVADTALVDHLGSPVQVTETLRPIGITEPQPGVYVVNLGQNMVGWVRLKVRGPAGTTITLRHAEMLNPDGTIYTANLRSARQTDQYTLRGGGLEEWAPRFTFHGFQYVELTGWPDGDRPTLDSLVGEVVRSAAPISGTFACSDERVNQLQHNIQWGQRGNYLEVPTDCPQRDERLGWTGDAQAFVRTGCYNMAVDPFFSKWLRDLEDSQLENGAVPDVAPHVAVGAGTAAWGDAMTICPWTVYQMYGDTALLAEHFDAMAAWVDYLEVHSDNLIRPNQGYGDWLAIGADTPRDVIGTAYFAHSANLTAQAAEVLGLTEQARHYGNLFRAVRAAFNRAFVSDDGRIKGDTQTCYLLGLAFDLLPNDLRDEATAHLVADIEGRGDRLSTGFVGVSLLNPTLTAVGHNDLAYRLLLQTEFPSWLYPVLHGATTIWERWDGWTEEGGFQNPGMNSFNHYAFGSVGEWLFETVAGIAPLEPGFRRLRIVPQPGPGLSWARATYDSVYGPIASAWRIEGDTLTLAVTVPPNTTAEVRVPTSDPDSVRENGHRAGAVEGVTAVWPEPDGLRVELGSGSYTFTARWAADAAPPPTRSSAGRD